MSYRNGHWAKQLGLSRDSPDDEAVPALVGFVVSTWFYIDT